MSSRLGKQNVSNQTMALQNSDFDDDEHDYNMEDDGDSRTHLSDPLHFLSYCYNME